MVDGRTRGFVLAIGAVVVGSVFVNAAVAHRMGWAVEGDNGVLAVRARDVLSAHPPLLGNPTTAGAALHHPGPLEFVALAMPVWVLGPAGLLYGAAAVNAAGLAAIAWLAGRRGGWRGALAGWGAGAVLAWSLGSEVLRDAYNPHQALVPLAVLAVAGWSLACRDPAGLPVAVVAASYAAQAHVLYALVALPMAVAVAVVAALVRPARRVVLGSAGLAVLLWLPPIVAELRPGPGNLAGLLAVGREGASIGPGFALARLADVLLGGSWLARQPDPWRLASQPAGWRQALALVLVALLAAAGWRALRAGRRTAAALAGAALVTLAAVFLATARLPAGGQIFQPYSHRPWWVAAVLFWFAAAWLAADALRAWLGSLDGRLLAVPALVASVAVAASVQIVDDRGSVSFGAVEALTDAAVEDRRDGPWLVEGAGAQSVLSVHPAMVAALLLRGVDVRVLPELGEAFGFHRVATAADPDLAGELLVVSGPEPPPVPPGFELVARFDAAADAERTGRRNASVFVDAEHLAVFARSAP